MQLASVDDVKYFLEKTDSDHDTLLDLLLTNVSARIEQFLNRKMHKEARTEYFSAGRSIIYLPAYPIDLSAALSVIDSTETLTINDDYYVWEDEGKIEFYSVPLYVEPKQITITWTGGYLTYATVPAAIQHAVILQTSLIFKRRQNIGNSGVSLPDGSISMMVTESLLPEVKDILKSYRRIPGMK
jgi:hypothetical protein